MESQNRREFLRLLSGSSALILSGSAGLLSGCGNDAGSSRGGTESFTGSPSGSSNGGPGASFTPSIPISQILGRVDLTQIGGKGLTVQTLFSKAMVGADGSFSATVSRDNPQLILVIDSNGNIRGMTIWSPASTAVPKAADLVPDFSDLIGKVVNTKSTVFSLLMLTPGMLVTDAKELLTRAVSIVALVDWAILLAYVAEKLFLLSVKELVTDQNFQKVISDCINQYIQDVMGLTFGNAANAQSHLVPSAQRDPQTSGTVNLTNPAWRFVTVFREKLDSNSNPQPGPGFPKLANVQDPGFQHDLLSGANAVTWGNLFTLQAGLAGTADDTGQNSDKSKTDLTSSGFRYWFTGPGDPKSPFAQVEDSLAQSAGFGQNEDPLLASVVFYAVFPVMDLLAGGLAEFKQAKLALDTYAHLQTTGVSLHNQAVALESNSGQNKASALLDAWVSLVGLTLGFAEAAGLTIEGGLSAPEIAAAGAALGTVAAVMGIFNFLVFGQYLLLEPDFSSVDIANPASYDILLLGDPSGGDVGRADVNALGHMAYLSDVSGHRTVFLHTGSSGPDTVVLPGAAGQGVGRVALNDLDHVAYDRHLTFGTQAPFTDEDKVFLWTGPLNTPTDLGDLGGIFPANSLFNAQPLTFLGDLNNNDVVVGFSIPPGAPAFDTAVYIWANGHMSQVGPLSGAANSFMGVNDTNQIVVTLAPPVDLFGGVVPGETTTLFDGAQTTVLTTNPSILGDFLGAINNAQQAIYNQNSSSDGSTLPILWDKTHGPTQLPFPANSSSAVTHDLNNHGQVVGKAILADNISTIGVLWKDGKVIDLNSGVPAGSPTIVDAVAIGDGGHIAVLVLIPNVNTQWALLTPKA